MSTFQSFAFVASVVGAALMIGAASAQTATPVPPAPVASAPSAAAPVAKAQKKLHKKPQKKVMSSVVVMVTNSRSVALSELDATPRRNSTKDNCLQSRSRPKNFCEHRNRKILCVQPAWRLCRWTDSTSVDLCKDKNVNLIE